MTIVVVTPPASEPVTEAEVKYHCRIDSYNQDAASETVLLASLIAAARKHAENELNRYLITQTLDVYFDKFPNVIKLPPIQSVTSITYIDLNGDSQVLSSSLYQVDSASIPSRITPAYDQVWPSTRTQNNAVIVRIVAGYGAASAVPDCIKHWMLMRIQTLYDNRSQAITDNGNLVFEQSFIDGLLDPERVKAHYDN